MDELRNDINSHQLIFIGESIHGVSEFKLFILDFIKTYLTKGWICFFEADHLGIELSKYQNSSVEKALLNFPLVMRTQETLDILIWLAKNNIPYYGIDSIPRRSLSDYPDDWLIRKNAQDKEYIKAKDSQTFFEWRSEFMAQKIADIINSFHKNKKVLILMHNLHIKNRGSIENINLRLKSVKERMDTKLHSNSISIAQVAMHGNAIHNNLVPFSFYINDKQAVESLAAKNGRNQVIYSATDLPLRAVAYHHGFEKENIPAKIQYAWIVIFKKVNSSKLL